MKILQIKLSLAEQAAIYNELIKRFNIENKRQTISFDLSDMRSSYNLSVDNIDDYDLSVFGEDYKISIESTLELYTEYPEPDGNNQTSIAYRSVVKFRITFFHDGEEVEANDEQIYERIAKYYEI